MRPAIRQAVDLLRAALRERGIDLQVLPGAEVRLDERMDELLARDEILTLADAGRHILLELPWDALIDIEPLLVQLACRGVHVILAHPGTERPAAPPSADPASLAGVRGRAAGHGRESRRGLGASRQARRLAIGDPRMPGLRRDRCPRP